MNKKPVKSLRFSPLRLLICLESDVNGLSFGIFTSYGVTLFNISVLLQQRLHIAKVCVLRNPADDDLRCLTTRKIPESMLAKRFSNRTFRFTEMRKKPAHAIPSNPIKFFFRVFPFLLLSRTYGF